MHKSNQPSPYDLNNPPQINQILLRLTYLGLGFMSLFISLFLLAGLTSVEGQAALRPLSSPPQAQSQVQVPSTYTVSLKHLNLETQNLRVYPQTAVCPLVRKDADTVEPPSSGQVDTLLSGRLLTQLQKLFRFNANQAILNKRINLLFLGTDSRANEAKNQGRTDTIMLVTMDLRTRKIGVLSIPRDLWVLIPDYGEDRINTAYRKGELNKYPGGGPALLMETIRANFGVVVDYYVLVDFEGFIQIVDTLGGLDICVPQTIDSARFYGYTPLYVDAEAYYSFVPVPVITQAISLEDTSASTDDTGNQKGYQFLYVDAGWHTLNGEVALRYARSRASSTGDFARIQRQQAVLMSMREKALMTDLMPLVPAMWAIVSETFETNLTPGESLLLGQIILETPFEQIRTEAFRPHQTLAYRSAKGASILLPRRDALKNVIESLFGNTYSLEPLTQLEAQAAHLLSNSSTPTPTTTTTTPASSVD